MPAPTLITDLSTTAASNSPAGSETPSVLDDVQRAHAAFIAQLRDNKVSWCGTAGGTANAFTLTPSPASTSYVTGQAYQFIAVGSNTGAATVNVSALGAKAVQYEGAALAGNEILSGKLYSIRYDGTQFQLDRSSKGQTLSATSRILGRKSAGVGVVEECTLSEILDFISSAAQGDILYRDSSAWARLGAGTSGQFLTTQGAAANPVWSDGSGKIVQVVEGTPYTTYSSTATTVPADDTIPQNTEGAEWVTVTITPTSATNRLRIEAHIPTINASVVAVLTAALFQDSTANALSAAAQYSSGNGYYENMTVVYEMAAGTTSATTFKLRAGASTGTLYVNGDGSARKMGGTIGIRIRVTEIKA